MTDLSYPIGKFSFATPAAESDRESHLVHLEAAPALLRAAVHGLTAAQLDTPYRPGGWTVRQVVHHVPDSHMNAYIRFRLALTEDAPTIKPYDQAAWANLPDRDAPVEVSLVLLEQLHRRWMTTLRGMKPEEWTRTFRHPDLGVVSLEKNLALYSWHGRHHTAHITGLLQRMGW